MTPKPSLFYRAQDFARLVWRTPLRGLSRTRALLFQTVRVLLLSVSQFLRHDCMLHASALTYLTLLAVVPILAMLFAISKGFGVEESLREALQERFADQQQVIDFLMQFASNFLSSMHGGLVAGIGIGLLFVIIIRMFGNIESSFNHIWGVIQGRSWARKCSDYLSLMLICPIFVILSGGATALLASQAQFWWEEWPILESIKPVVELIIWLLPFCIIWLLLGFLYVFLPNTRVRISAATIGGFIGALLYQLVQWGYFTSQIGIGRYNAVYGSFVALPIFLIWVQMSWLVVLYGAEIAFAIQNHETYEFEEECLSVSLAHKRLLTLHVMQTLVRLFQSNMPALTIRDLYEKTEIPMRLLQQILYECLESGLLAKVLRQDQQEAYQPAHDPQQLTVQSIIDALVLRGTTAVPVAQSLELAHLQAVLQKMKELLEHSEVANTPIAQL